MSSWHDTLGCFTLPVYSSPHSLQYFILVYWTPEARCHWLFGTAAVSVLTHLEHLQGLKINGLEGSPEVSWYRLLIIRLNEYMCSSVLQEHECGVSCVRMYVWRVIVLEQLKCSGPHFLKLLNYLGQTNCSVLLCSNNSSGSHMNTCWGERIDTIFFPTLLDLVTFTGGVLPAKIQMAVWSCFRIKLIGPCLITQDYQKFGESHNSQITTAFCGIISLLHFWLLVRLWGINLHQTLFLWSWLCTNTQLTACVC
jgi:hypothetical protein